MYLDHTWRRLLETDKVVAYVRKDRLQAELYDEHNGSALPALIVFNTGLQNANFEDVVVVLGKVENMPLWEKKHYPDKQGAYCYAPKFRVGKVKPWCDSVFIEHELFADNKMQRFGAKNLHQTTGAQVVRAKYLEKCVTIVSLPPPIPVTLFSPLTGSSHLRGDENGYLEADLLPTLRQSVQTTHFNGEVNVAPGSPTSNHLECSPHIAV